MDTYQRIALVIVIVAASGIVAYCAADDIFWGFAQRHWRLDKRYYHFEISIKDEFSTADIFIFILPLSPTSIPFPPKKSYLSYLSGVAGEHQVQPTLRWKQFVILQVFCFIYFEFIHHIKYLPQGMSLVATIYMASAVEPPITVFVQTAPTTTSYLFTFSE